MSMSYREETVIVIPALDPDERMTELVKGLRKRGFRYIIIVDDGSCIESRSIFDACESDSGCKVIRHGVNFGKGIALKSAFGHILSECSDVLYVVTADCDGQHSVDDIDKCASLCHDHPGSLVLGCRSFDDAGIPLRSRLGNKCTKAVLGFFSGLNVSDTQTGLRGVPIDLIRDIFIKTKGERYEYEMNVLLDAKENHISIEEFSIQTIYLENNKSSHFNPLLDSIRIYKTFLKFMLSSFSSFLIDIVVFWLAGFIFREVIPDDHLLFGVSTLILCRTVIARLVSSIYNFIINKTKVFNKRSSSVNVAIKYYVLALVQLTLSVVLVNYAFLFIPFATVRKIIVDTILFLLSYIVQREWVFRSI